VGATGTPLQVGDMDLTSDSQRSGFDLSVRKSLGHERLFQRFFVELALILQAKPQLAGLEVHLNRALLYPR
jgi:hypothetical protein